MAMFLQRMVRVSIAGWLIAFSLMFATNRFNAQASDSYSRAHAIVATAQPMVQPAEAMLPSRAVRTGTSKHVTVMIDDMSGSMAENDHDGVRCSAANAYISLSGPGDFIGVIGLVNSDGRRGGLHHFLLSQVWSQPKEMATTEDRKAALQLLAQESGNCHPGGYTPTYDALAQALHMLLTATHNRQIPGSVILLSDGDPEPDSKAQIDAIEAELLPQFQADNFPIDVVALGPNASGFHSFLNDISSATAGAFYDDGNGVVPGISPLNIMPFFAEIFARRNGRIVRPDIPLTTLQGEPISRNFQVGDYVDHLDVIAVKNQPRMTLTLTAPDGTTLPPEVPGTSVFSDPHYAIFSIDGPQAGDWQLNADGSGQFLMDSLASTNLRLSVTNPTPQSPVLPLGQPFDISSVLTRQGSSLNDTAFTVSGTLFYTGAPTDNAAPFSQGLKLTKDASGAYQTQALVPESATPGSYEIDLCASQVSDVCLASAQLVIRLERFPAPLLFSTQAGAIIWDTGLRWLYSLPLGFIQWLSRWPLENLPAQPAVELSGQVELAGKPYSSATVTATAINANTNKAVPVAVVNDGAGRFRLRFPPLVSGLFNVAFKTSGSFEDSHGDWSTTFQRVVLTITPATPFQTALAWLITGIYLSIPLLLLNFLARPAPLGYYRDPTGALRRFTTRRSLVNLLLRRNRLSRAIGGRPGLQVRITRKGKQAGTYLVRPRGRAGRCWRNRNGRELPRKFTLASGVVYKPDQGDPGLYQFTPNARSQRGGHH